MSFDPVPWMIGGGAQHSAEVARTASYAAVRGNEGVFGPGDLKVSARTVPDGTLELAPGACSVLCRASGQAYQAYIGRNPTLATVAPAATTASARSDLIVARVEDPWLAGEPWADPADPTVGPYIFPRIIPGVPNTTKTVTGLNLGYSAIPLARIDIPANTGTFTQSMVTDLRKIANPHRDRTLYTVNPGGVNSITSGTYADWMGSWSVDVPVWATRVVIVVAVSGARLDRVSTSVSGTANGLIRAALSTYSGAGAGTGTVNVFTQGSGFDLETTPSNSTGRYSIGAGDTVSIPSAFRGTTQILTIQGTKNSGSKNLYCDTVTFGTVDIEFQESAA